MKPKYLDFGERLTQCRKEKHLSQKQCIMPLGDITIQMLSNWENGHTFPSYNYLIKISSFYNVSLDYLIMGKKSNNNFHNYINYRDIVNDLVSLDQCSNINFMAEWPVGCESYQLNLLTQNKIVMDFWKEYEILKKAKELLSKDSYESALVNLINKYDSPILNNH